MNNDRIALVLDRDVLMELLKLATRLPNRKIRAETVGYIANTLCDSRAMENGVFKWLRTARDYERIIATRKDQDFFSDAKLFLGDDYRKHIDEIAEDILAAIKNDEIHDEDKLAEVISERVGRDYYVSFTQGCQCVMLVSKNDSAAFDEGIEIDATNPWPVLATYAMVEDIRDALDAKDLNLSMPVITPEALATLFFEENDPDADTLTALVASNGELWSDDVIKRRDTPEEKYPEYYAALVKAATDALDRRIVSQTPC